MNTTLKPKPVLPFWQNVESQAREWSPFNDEGTVFSAVFRHQQNILLCDVRSVLHDQRFGFLSEIGCRSYRWRKNYLDVLFVWFLEIWRYLYVFIPYSSRFQPEHFPLHLELEELFLINIKTIPLLGASTSCSGHNDETALQENENKKIKRNLPC